MAEKDGKELFAQFQQQMQAQNRPDAVKALIASAEAGYVEAQAVLGGEYLYGHMDGTDYQQAFYWSEKAAAQDNPMALTNLGILYLYGHGVQADVPKALDLFRRAAGKYFKANRYLGLCYAGGIGVEQDNAAAAAWYQRGAKAGDITSQYLLGECYENGTGVEQDMEKAVAWYKKSAERGDEISEPAIKALRRLGIE